VSLICTGEEISSALDGATVTFGIVLPSKPSSFPVGVTVGFGILY
jgi:hypothetical protein